MNPGFSFLPGDVGADAVADGTVEAPVLEVQSEIWLIGFGLWPSALSARLRI